MLFVFTVVYIRSVGLVYYSLQVCTFKQYLAYHRNPQPLVITMLWFLPIWLFQILHMIDIIYICFSLSSLPHLVLWSQGPTMLAQEQDVFLSHGWIIFHYVRVCVYTHIFCIHSSSVQHLGCFHLLTVVINVIINMGVPISLWNSFFIPFGYILRNRISRWYDKLYF